MPSSLVAFLAYGAIGLGGILLYLAYRLLSQLATQGPSSQGVLRALYAFMCVGLLMVLAGLAAEVVRSQLAVQLARAQSEEPARQVAELAAQLREAQAAKTTTASRVEQLTSSLRLYTVQLDDIRFYLEQLSKLARKVPQGAPPEVTTLLGLIEEFGRSRAEEIKGLLREVR